MGRMDRINQLIKREVGKIIQQDMQDPRFQFVSITQVRVSPDLKNARIGFSFLGDKEQAQNVQDALGRAAGLIRHLVSQKIELRHTPKIEFEYDPSLDYSAGVEEVLENIKRDIPFGNDPDDVMDNNSDEGESL